jgi:hypothetical protein
MSYAYTLVTNHPETALALFILCALLLLARLFVPCTHTCRRHSSHDADTVHAFRDHHYND